MKPPAESYSVLNRSKDFSDRPSLLPRHQHFLPSSLNLLPTATNNMANDSFRSVFVLKTPISAQKTLASSKVPNCRILQESAENRNSILDWRPSFVQIFHLRNGYGLFQKQMLCWRSPLERVAFSPTPFLSSHFAQR